MKARCISLWNVRGTRPHQEPHNKIFFPEYEARTDIRIRVRRGVIRIRVRNTAIRVRRVIGAQQTEGPGKSTCLSSFFLNYYILVTLISYHLQKYSVLSNSGHFAGFSKKFSTGLRR